ncbi:hypothetical protein [Salipiger sp.]|uniref:hypothetical protein n=1 Tax=Salipiger sp. TaxID=2078585 RepID=UPI003A9764C2
MIISTTLAVAVSFPAAAADVRERNATVASGKMERLFVHSDYGTDCRGGPAPKIALKTKPKNGKFGTAASVEVVKRDGHKCDGKKIDGIGVFYQSKPGFKGTDHVVYQRGTGKNAFVMDVTVTVK